MRYLVILAAVSMVFVVGCRKNQPEATTPYAMTETGTGQGTPQTGAKKELATGDMKDLLLTLQRVHFPLDTATLVDDAKAALDEAAKKLIAHGEVALYVDGHTDARGTTEHNMALGERRSDTVVEYLVRLGVPQERLSALSHGEENPIATGGGEVAMAQNRRVEFRLMRGDIELVLEDSGLVDDQGNPLSASAPAPAEAPAAAPAPAPAAAPAPASDPKK